MARRRTEVAVSVWPSCASADASRLAASGLDSRPAAGCRAANVAAYSLQKIVRQRQAESGLECIRSRLVSQLKCLQRIFVEQMVEQQPASPQQYVGDRRLGEMTSLAACSPTSRLPGRKGGFHQIDVRAQIAKASLDRVL